MTHSGARGPICGAMVALSLAGGVNLTCARADDGVFGEDERLLTAYFFSRGPWDDVAVTSGGELGMTGPWASIYPEADDPRAAIFGLESPRNWPDGVAPDPSRWPATYRDPEQYPLWLMAEWRAMKWSGLDFVLVDTWHSLLFHADLTPQAGFQGFVDAWTEMDRLGEEPLPMAMLLETPFAWYEPKDGDATEASADGIIELWEPTRAFLRLWSYAYSKTGDEKYLDWCNNLLDHLEWSRVDGDGPLPTLSNRSSRPLPDRPSWGNTMLVGVSLLEYAPLLGDTATAERFRSVGEEYIAMVAAQELPDPDREPIFHGGRGMGGGKAHWGQVFRVTGNEYFLDAARNMATPYLNLEEIPEETWANMKAQSFGVPIDLMMDMYEFEGDRVWLDAAERYARLAIETLYWNGLFRAAPDLFYQDSHTGTATIIYALVRVHAAVEGLDVEVPPNVYQF